MPSVFVTWGASFGPCDSLMSTTVAPGTVPPDWSVTVPVTLPVEICAEADHTEAANTTSAPTSTLTLRLLGIDPPSLSIHSDLPKLRWSRTPRTWRHTCAVTDPLCTCKRAVASFRGS